MASGDGRAKTYSETEKPPSETKYSTQQSRNTAANALFSVAGSNIEVSEDCVVADAVDQNPSPKTNFPANREKYREFAIFGPMAHIG